MQLPAPLTPRLGRRRSGARNNRMSACRELASLRERSARIRLTELNKCRTHYVQSRKSGVLPVLLTKYPQGVPHLSTHSRAAGVASPGLKGSVSMSLVPLLASLVMAGAGCGAIAAIVITVRAQLPALRKLMADSRAIAADRDFLVQITVQTLPAVPMAAVRPRRTPVRAVRSGPVSTPAAIPMRAAA